MKILDFGRSLLVLDIQSDATTPLQRALAIVMTALLLIAIAHSMISKFEQAGHFHKSAIVGNVTPIGFDVASDGGWEAIETNDGFHALIIPVKIEPKTYYSVGFDVTRLPREIVRITSDLFAAGYDTPEQEFTKLLGMKNLHRRLHFTVNAGDSPTGAVLRVFYTGLQGAQIANVEIVQIPKWLVWIERFCYVAMIILVAATVWIAVAIQRMSAPLTKGVLLLLVLYPVAVLLRFATFVFIPYWSGDEYVYKSLAAAIWQFGKPGQLTASMIADSVSVPNMIYPLLISPAFAAGQDFYVVIRLINAATINLALFPIYFLARRFISERKALMVAMLSVAIPFINFGAYAVTEVAFFPVFLLCVWLMVEVILSPAKVWSVIAFGGFAGLLLNIRLTGMTVIPAYLACSIWVAWREGGFREWLTRPRWIIPLISCAATFMLLQWISRGQWFGGLGVYETHAARSSGVLEAFRHNPSGSLDLVLGHLTTLSMPYAIPLGLLLSGVLMTLRPKRKVDQLDVLLVVSGVATVMMIGLTLVFTAAVSGSDLGGLARWHSRYYFSIYPLLILVTAVLVERSAAEKLRNRWLVVMVVALLVAANVLFTVYRSGLNFPWFGALADNMDVHWYRHAKWFFWPAIVGTIVVTVLWYARNRWFNTVSVFAVLAWLFVANMGVARTVDFGNPEGSDNCGKISALFLESHPGRFAIIADSRPSRVSAGFWNPYLPELTLQTETRGAPLALSTFIPSVDYFVVNGDVQIDTSVAAVYSSGKCRIYESLR